MDENEIDSPNDPLDDNPYDATHLSDVIEAIQETDPDFKQSKGGKLSSMLNGGGQVLQHTNSSNQNSTRARCAAELEIIEQPASKALRFRYECEGRSAGSIPGASSTPENKTYPEIAIRGYQGNAVVLVSCVTKDSPYLAHPHNLVGKGCTKGVCTMHVLPENMMRVQFQNLGIQCVKKRDIESSLVKRQQIRVDPYKNGFRHKNSATSIDLNAVRLCFQAYLPDQEGKMTVPLRPVVSDVIYDKKAIADLSIVGLCSCVSHVNGGTSLILLCEKVAKEDIEIHFFEEDAHGNRVWQEKADFQPSNVHKQTAIMFKTPPYRTLDISEPVRVHIQLYRPSDRMTSEALPFEYLPLDSGRMSHWTYKGRSIGKKINYELFDSILAKDNAKLFAKSDANSAKINKANNGEEKSYNEILDQVAELDEIYSDTHAQLTSNKSLLNDDSFDDACTYTSLQLAFKNPVLVTDATKHHEEVDLKALSSTPPKRDNDLILPPLPPKRTKKVETFIGDSMSSIPLTDKQAVNLLTRSGSMRSTSVSRSQSFNLQRPKSQGELVPPVKRLPPVPNTSATLPNRKKRGFFSKLFSRSPTRNSNMVSREPSVTPSYNNSARSLQVDQTLSKSSGNISTHSSNSVRIRLKDESPPPLNGRTGTLSPVLCNTIATHKEEEQELQFDLTEAENYALYTSMAPHATQSEFDEFSCYYAPVEGGKLLTKSEVAARQ
ncbi:hypothetical protein ABEB36_004857 [Hypothenemus hampei]|uniref:RHD domain-containing protein n=1 Tax=Hypothenemus hampei TaxID=57062 RepID=A0ABD1EW30_HYPHA